MDPLNSAPSLPLLTKLWRYWSFIWLFEPAVGNLPEKAEAVRRNQNRLRHWMPTYLLRHAALLAVLVCAASLLHEHPLVALLPALLAATETVLLTAMGLQATLLCLLRE